MKLDDTGMIAAVGFKDDIAPPHEHGVENDRATPSEHDPGRAAMHPHDGTDREDEGGDRADDRPRARIDEMIIMVFGVAVGHGVSFSLGLTVSVSRRGPSSGHFVRAGG